MHHMSTRLYRVKHKATNANRLIDAQNPSQVLRHVSEDLYEIAPATPKDVAELIGTGVRVEACRKAEAA
jgi:hypothetical protein